MPDEVADRQFAASNSTLNYLLGGRSKSWMTSTPSTLDLAATTRPAPSNDTSTTIKRPVGRPRKGRHKHANNEPTQHLETDEGASYVASAVSPAKKPVAQPHNSPLLARPAEKRPVGRPRKDASSTSRPASRDDSRAPIGASARALPPSGRIPARPTQPGSVLLPTGSHTDSEVDADERRPYRIVAGGAPFPAGLSAFGATTLSHHVNPPIARDFERDTSDGEALASAAARTFQQRERCAPANKSPNTTEPEAQVQDNSVNTYPVPTTHDTFHHDLLPFPHTPAAIYQAGDAMAIDRPQRVTPPSPTPPLTEPQLPDATSPPQTTAQSPASRRGIASSGASERRRRASSAALAQALESPDKQRRLDTSVQEYLPSFKCQNCRRHGRECDGQIPCLSCRSFKIKCRYGSLFTSASDGRRQQQPEAPARLTGVPSSTPEGSPTTAQIPNLQHMSVAAFRSRLTRQPSNPMVTISSAHAQPAMPPPQLQAAPAQNFFDKTRCMSFIDRLHHPQGPTGPPRQMTTAEGARMQTLKEAVAREDVTFLLIHQMWCIASYDPQRLPSGFQNRNDVNSAFGILDELLRKNRNLTPAILGFCATFPAPLSEILRVTPAAYQLRHDCIEDFFNRTATSWVAFRQGISARGHPPMVHEITETLGIHSPTLQRLVFLTLTRVMWRINESHWLNLAENLFQRNQADWHRFLTRGVKFPLKRGTLETYHAWFVERYIILRRVQENYRGVHFMRVPIPMNSPLLDLENTPNYLLLDPHGRGSSAGERPISVGSLSGHASVVRQEALSNSSGSDLVAVRGTLPNAVSGQAAGFWDAPHAPLSGLTAPTQHVLDHNHGLLPNSNWLAAQQIAPNPDILALHQTHLRGPLLQLLETPTDTTMKEVFQHVDAFELQPFALDADNGYAMTHSFVVTDELFKRTAKEVYNEMLNQDVRGLYPDSLQYRLRSCPKKAFSNNVAVRDRWAVTETSWHPNVYMKFNGHHLQLRRKLHHGKDIPVDITSLVQPGLNNLEVLANVQENDKTPGEYLFAVEIVGISSAASIRRYCKDDGFLKSADSLNEIKRQLGGESAADDDDIMMVSSTLTIPLFEPFSNAKMCDIPVRGRGCLHRECFDLDTFLVTRPAYYKPPNMSQTPRLPADIEKILCETPGVKGVDPELDTLYALERPEGPSAVDCWTCPICRGDARPQSLIVDGFLVEVRRELERQGKLDTRAIVVQADGTWRPKPEKTDGEMQRTPREKGE